MHSEYPILVLRNVMGAILNLVFHITTFLFGGIAIYISLNFVFFDFNRSENVQNQRSNLLYLAHRRNSQRIQTELGILVNLFY
jgi:hypothetical protein